MYNDKLLQELWGIKEPIVAYFWRIKEIVEFSNDTWEANDITDKAQM